MSEIAVIDAGALIGLADPLVRFDAALPRFLAEKRAARTKALYRRALTVYRDHCAGAGLSPFGGDAVQTYNAAQRRLWQIGELAADTVRLRLSVLRTFLIWCYDYDLTAITPGRLRRWLHLPPARELSPRDVLTGDEARALIGAARDDRDRLLLRLMLDAGLRVSEALAVRPCDLSRDDGRCWLHVQPSKGEKERDVEIPTDLWRDLTTWTRERRLPPERCLIHLDAGNAWRMVGRTAARAGITKDVTPHSLRHSHATHLRLAGYPLEAIGVRLGHGRGNGDLRITLRYTRPAELVQAQPLPALPWQTAQ